VCVAVCADEGQSRRMEQIVPSTPAAVTTPTSHLSYLTNTTSNVHTTSLCDQTTYGDLSYSIGSVEISTCSINNHNTLTSEPSSSNSGTIVENSHMSSHVTSTSSKSQNSRRCTANAVHAASKLKNLRKCDGAAFSNQCESRAQRQRMRMQSLYGVSQKLTPVSLPNSVAMVSNSSENIFALFDFSDNIFA
jgi:hypothetical protein